MKIRLVDVDGWDKKRGKRFPNLALMKISAWYKAQGHNVAWATGYDADLVFASKMFTFTPDPLELAAFRCPVERGGTGYSIDRKLPPEIEAMPPDYSLYPSWRYAVGFLTRGCVRACSWCVVPQKEGSLQITGDIETVAAGRKTVVLLDNNFLAAPDDFVTEQLDKAARLGLRLDFNQGLDARLVTPENAARLARCRWREYIRFACDSAAMIDPVARAVLLIREAGYTGRFFSYLLVQDDIGDAEKRLRALLRLDVRPFAQPYRAFEPDYEVDPEQADFARFVNVKGGQLCSQIHFKDYRRF